MSDDTDCSSYAPDNDSGEESPLLEASGVTKKRRKMRKQRQRSKKDSHTSALETLAAKRNASEPTEPKKKVGRRKSSLIWKHCHQKIIKGQIYTVCNYCKDQQWCLGGSTSSARTHVLSKHLDKISQEELNKIDDKARGNERTTPTSKLPTRSPVAVKSPMNRKLTRHSLRGREYDTLLCKAMLSGSLSFNLLDDVKFAMFVEAISSGVYTLPCRAYMTNTVVPIVYNGCVDAVKNIIKDVPNLSLTTDAWKSFSKQSYITITCHIIDDQGKLHEFILNTTEIKKRHTSVNLFQHIQKVLSDWGLESIEGVTLNRNNSDQCQICYTQNIE